MKIIIGDIETETTGPIPGKLELTSGDALFDSIMEEMKDNDTVESYIHRCEDANGKPSFQERFLEALDETVLRGEVKRHLVKLIGAPIDGYSYDVSLN